MQKNRTIVQPLILIPFIIVLLLFGCVPVMPANVQQLIKTLQERGVDLRASNPAFGTVSAVFPPELYPLLLIGYERRSNRGEFIDALLIHTTTDSAKTQQTLSALQAYAMNPYGLRGLDLAGPVRYYQCDKTIIVYQASWQTNIDPVIDGTLAESCGSAFISYPVTP